MDNFKVIYQILKILEKSLDCDEFNPDSISPELLGVSQNRWNALIGMLLDDGYIKGAKVVHSICGSSVTFSDEFRITLRGLEYLNDNTFMKRAANLAKGIKDTVPGL